jgi:dihydropteroate synthase
MAILNCTPDSFSDGGQCLSVDAAVALARKAEAAGAVVLDVGGESTRPGAESVTVDEELRRVVPVIRALRERVGLPLSIDTRKAAVFEEAWRAGASMLNDVSGLRHDPQMAAVAARTDAAVVVMHMRGTPASMNAEAQYTNVVEDVLRELGHALQMAREAGIRTTNLIADPGLGFAKDTIQNLSLLTHLRRFTTLGVPLLLGPSRKRFLGEITGQQDPLARDTATAALVALLAHSPVGLFRVHAPAAARDALRVARAFGAAAP